MIPGSHFVNNTCPSFYTISQEKLYLEANDRDNKVINNKANNSSVVLLDPVNKFVLSRVCTCHSICIIYAVLLYGLWFINCSDCDFCSEHVTSKIPNGV